MRFVVALVVALTGTAVLGAPAEARGASRVTLTAPGTHVATKAVVLTGKVKGRASAVRIQQKKSGRWVVVRKAVLDQHPWLAGNIFNAFNEARKRSIARISHAGATVAPLPWLADAVARAKAVLGEDFWPYGVDANRPTLEAFLRWAHEQGVCHRLLTPDELFPPQTLKAVKV